MSTCVEKLSHSCGSSDGLQVFLSKEGEYTGYCFSCGTYVRDPYGDKPKGYTPKVKVKSEEEKQAELQEVANLPVIEQAHRGLRVSVTEYFGVKCALSQENGVEPHSYFFPYEKDGEVVGYKVKTLDKKMWVIGTLKGTEPFGWRKAITSGRKVLFITEGEEDAEAVFDILQQTSNEQYKDAAVAVISIPNGADGAVKSLSPYFSTMQSLFEKVVIVFDNDTVGVRARNNLLKVAPWMKWVELPGKDANECLLKGRLKGARTALLFGQVDSPKTTGLLFGSSLEAKAMEPPKWGMTWPFETLTRITRGIRRGETYYCGAGVKMGKSELVDTIGAHLMIEHDLPVLFVKPEQPPVDTYRRLVGKVAGKIFHDPDKGFDREAFVEASKKVGDKAIILDHYQFVSWESLKDELVYAHSHGVRDFILDPITCFTTDMTDSEANVELRKIAAEISQMTLDLESTAYIFCHLRAPSSGPSHERGGKVESVQFAGSRAMMRSCNLMIGMEGNRDPDLPEEEKNIRYITVLENREFGTTVRFPVMWDKNTGLFREIGYA